MQVKFIHCTPDAEKLIAYCARVSSDNQNNPSFEKLIGYLIKYQHWSPFEMCNLCLEIITTRTISAQILRHRSFSFQEWSQRYSQVLDHEIYEARRQDIKNRQNSIDDMFQEDKEWFRCAQERVWNHTYNIYEEALNKGIAKELARTLLPLGTSTKLYMNGSLRSWIHYIKVRTDPSTQKEHRDIAEACKKIFIEQFPIIGAVAFK